MSQEIYINRGGRFGEFLVSDGTNLTWNKSNKATVFLYQPDNVITDKNNRVVCLDEAGNFVYADAMCYYDQAQWKAYGYIYSSVSKTLSTGIGMAVFFGMVVLLILLSWLSYAIFVISEKDKAYPEIYIFVSIIFLVLLALAGYGMYYFLNQTIRLTKLSDPLA
jgi:hypothetical protein